MNVQLNSPPPEKRYRYPGAVPFHTGQSHIFFGRQHITKELYKLIRSEPVVVLYGKSGLGKSSLLNAGIVPACREDGIRTPLVIRFGAWTESQQETPLHIIKTALSHSSYPVTFPHWWLPDDDSLWSYAKWWQLNGNGSLLLVFDQFEEIFSYPDHQVTEFQRELAELLNTGIPLRFRRYLETVHAPDLTENEEEILEKPLNIRLLFAVRSDRMHLLNRLNDYLPNVLRHCFELKALTRKDAEDAIRLPASAQGSFITPPFGYTPLALQTLLNFLQDKDDGLVEGILLQMLCEHYERHLVEGKQIFLLDQVYIGDPSEVVRNYYEEKIKELLPIQQYPARRLIEDGLVSESESMRLSLHETYIIRHFDVEKHLLETLVDKRLLRSEPFLRGGYTYELSHDRLVPVVLEARTKRRESEVAEETRRLKSEAEKAKRHNYYMAALFSIAFLFMLAALWFTNYAFEQKKMADDKNKTLVQVGKLFDNLYFYKDQVALIYGKNMKRDGNAYYFINNNGDQITWLQEWDRAEQFDMSGFAKVRKDGRDYLLHITGREYPVTYTLDTINPGISAVDLRGTRLDSFPVTILKHPQLKVLILNGTPDNNNNLKSLPPEISRLDNLQFLYLRYCQLAALPEQIGDLKELQYLDLSNNNLTYLPRRIEELKGQKTYWSFKNPINPYEIGALLELDLSYNELNTLPLQLGALQNLQKLNLSGNPFPYFEIYAINEQLQGCVIIK